MNNTNEQQADFQRTGTSSCNDTSCCPPQAKTFRRTEAKVGRNDPCPCGNGKKFKKCCGRNT